MNNVLKCGIAGYGYMGQIRGKVIERNPKLELVGICDVNNETIAKTSVPTYSSYKELLDKDLDIMFVCVPNFYAPDICIDSMNAGVHVFCEKPPGRNVDDIKRMIRAENDKVKLMFGFNHRFHPGIIKAKVIVDSNRLGKIINIRGLYGKSGGVNFVSSWRNNRKISGGGILLDQGIHMLDLFQHFCGDFEYVKCFTGNSFWNYDVEDNAYVILKNKNGQNAFFHSSATMWKHTFKLDITLENGYIVVEGLLSKSGSYGREMIVIGKRQFEDEANAVGNPEEEITYFDRDLSWDLEVGEFIKCITQDKQITMCSSMDALMVMNIIEAAYKNSDLM